MRFFSKFMGLAFVVTITLQAVPAQAEEWRFCMAEIQKKETGSLVTVQLTDVFRSDKYPRYREDFEEGVQRFLATLTFLTFEAQCSSPIDSEEEATVARDFWFSHWEQEDGKPVIMKFPDKNSASAAEVR